MTGNGYRVSFRDDENVLKLIVAMVAQLCEYLNAMEVYSFSGDTVIMYLNVFKLW